jgi:hypothetical protein
MSSDLFRMVEGLVVSVASLRADVAALKAELAKQTTNTASAPLICRNSECDHCECICTTEKCDRYVGW